MMADSRGPHQVHYHDLIARLANLGEAAMEFEDEHQAWDMAPAEQRPNHEQVLTAYNRVNVAVANLARIIGQMERDYRLSMERVTQQAHREARSPGLHDAVKKED